MFTNAQVAALVSTLDARIARIEASLVAGAPISASAATTTRTASEALAEPKREHVTCKVHGKRFAVTATGAATGSGFHAGWCSAGFDPAS